MIKGEGITIFYAKIFFYLAIEGVVFNVKFLNRVRNFLEFHPLPKPLKFFSNIFFSAFSIFRFFEKH